MNRFHLILWIFFLPLLASCTGDRSDSPTGSIQFQLHFDQTAVTPQRKNQQLVLPENISSVRITTASRSVDYFVPYDLDIQSGSTIIELPPADDYFVQVITFDSNKSITHIGEVEGVAIQDGERTALVDVTMTEVLPTDWTAFSSAAMANGKVETISPGGVSVAGDELNVIGSFSADSTNQMSFLNGAKGLRFDTAVTGTGIGMLYIELYSTGGGAAYEINNADRTMITFGIVFSSLGEVFSRIVEVDAAGNELSVLSTFPPISVPNIGTLSNDIQVDLTNTGVVFSINGSGISVPVDPTTTHPIFQPGSGYLRFSAATDTAGTEALFRVKNIRFH